MPIVVRSTYWPRWGQLNSSTGAAGDDSTGRDTVTYGGATHGPRAAGGPEVPQPIPRTLAGHGQGITGRASHHPPVHIPFMTLTKRDGIRPTIS